MGGWVVLRIRKLVKSQSALWNWSLLFSREPVTILTELSSSIPRIVENRRLALNDLSLSDNTATHPRRWYSSATNKSDGDSSVNTVTGDGLNDQALFPGKYFTWWFLVAIICILNLGSTHHRMERAMGVKWPEDGSSTILRNVGGYKTTRCYIQKMSIYIVSGVSALTLALFVAGYIECCIFRSMGVFYLTTMAVNGYIFCSVDGTWMKYEYGALVE